MSEKLITKARPIKKFSAVGAAFVLAGAASVGLAAEAGVGFKTVNPNTGLPEVVLSPGIPAAILPEAINLVVVRETRKADPKEKLVPQRVVSQTKRSLPDPNYVSHNRTFRG